MKCDIVIYSEDTAVGLFYFAKWGYEGPFVMFIYNAADLSEKSMEEIKSLGVYCVKDDALASKIADHHRTGEPLADSFLEPVAKIYREFLKQTALPENEYAGYFRTRKISYTDLAKCSQPDMIREIIRNLKKSDDEDDKIQAFECEKLLKTQEVKRRTCLMTEKEKKALLFKHVECCSAIYELHDGTGFYKNSENEWCCTSGETQNCKIDWKTEPVKRLPKTYFSIKKINFCGVVVGIKKMRFSADLLIKELHDEWGNVKIWREKEEFRDVAIVYYANNHKRLVPVESVKVLENNMKRNDFEELVAPHCSGWQRRNDGFYSVSPDQEFAGYIDTSFGNDLIESMKAEAGLVLKSKTMDIEQLKRKFIWYLKEFMLDLPIMYEERVDGKYLFVRFNYNKEYNYTGFAILKSILEAICGKEECNE